LRRKLANQKKMVRDQTGRHFGAIVSGLDEKDKAGERMEKNKKSETCRVREAEGYGLGNRPTPGGTSKKIPITLRAVATGPLRLGTSAH